MKKLNGAINRLNGAEFVVACGDEGRKLADGREMKR
jgi:hypothetical protein